MATGGSKPDLPDSEKADDTINKLTCAICLETYRRPKLLKCFHTFCQRCLQGVAGSSSSLHCPSCRTLVLLPPGGVSALQTNFYIAEDLVSASPSPPQWLCEVCSDDREATHTCVQCQQKLCLPCRKYHDAFRLFGSHTVVPLTAEGAGGEGWGEGGALQPDRTEERAMCPKHPDQPLVLHCTQCGLDLCLHCKLTRHEGHPTDDLEDVRSAVKARLLGVLGDLSQQVKHVDLLMGAVTDRCTRLQQQRADTEQEFKSRADMLCQWVNQALDEAATSVQSTARQVEKSWLDQAEQLRNKGLALQARQSHALRVLKDGKEADIVSLEAELSSAPSSEAEVQEVERELTRDIPAFRVRRDTTAVNQPQLRTYVGVLESVQQSPCLEESASSLQPSASCSTQVAQKKKKKQPREIVRDVNGKLHVIHMRPISGGRLWIFCREGCGLRAMKLYDDEGQLLKAVSDLPVKVFDLSSVNDDVTVLHPESENIVYLFRPDGSSITRQIETNIKMKEEEEEEEEEEGEGGGTEEEEIQIEDVFSCPTGNHHYTVEQDDVVLFQAHFQYTTHSFEYSRGDMVLGHDAPSFGYLYAVSANGRYFAFFHATDARVDVYTPTDDKCILVSNYTTKDYPEDACFCRIDGQEYLLVLVLDDDQIHIVDHTSGGRFVRYLDTAPLQLDRPLCLTTDGDCHLWIACRGGRVVVVDL